MVKVPAVSILDLMKAFSEKPDMVHCNALIEEVQTLLGIATTMTEQAEKIHLLTNQVKSQLVQLNASCETILTYWEREGEKEHQEFVDIIEEPLPEFKERIEKEIVELTERVNEFIKHI